MINPPIIVVGTYLIVDNDWRKLVEKNTKTKKINISNEVLLVELKYVRLILNIVLNTPV